MDKETYNDGFISLQEFRDTLKYQDRSVSSKQLYVMPSAYIMYMRIHHDDGHHLYLIALGGPGTSDRRRLLDHFFTLPAIRYYTHADPDWKQCMDDFKEDGRFKMTDKEYKQGNHADEPISFDDYIFSFPLYEFRR